MFRWKFSEVWKVNAIVLILSVILPVFSKVTIFIHFKIKQDYIAKTLCINKDIPNSTCKGRCHLKKKLEKQDEQEEKQLTKSQLEKFQKITFVAINVSSFNFFKKEPTAFLLSLFLYDFYKFYYYLDFFHPSEKTYKQNN